MGTITIVNNSSVHSSNELNQGDNVPTDPVCGMFVSEASDLKMTQDGETYYFCSRDCLDKFSNPEKQAQKLRFRLIVGILFTIPVLVLTYTVTASYLRDYILIILASPVQFYSGYVFYSGSFHSLKERSANMDILIAVGSSTAFGFSAAVSLVHIALIGPGEVYFDASSAIVTLILVGQYMESRSKLRANITARNLLGLLPDKVHSVGPDGSVSDINSDSIEIGQTVRVYPGDRIPCDGTVASGESEVDESIISGEQKPVMKIKGDRVISGSININGSIDVTVEAMGKGSSLDEINRLIRKAATGRTRFQRITDSFSSIFVPSILTTATITGIFWYVFLTLSGYHDPFLIALLSFVSVVVIACPCAIGLATPVSLLVAADSSLSSGIVIRNPGAVERLAKVDYVVLDKTGTITDSIPEVTGIIENGMPQEDLLRFAVSLESHSTHPYARAVRKKAAMSGITPLPVTNIRETPGVGIYGICEGLNVGIARISVSGKPGFSLTINDQEKGRFELSYQIKENTAEGIRKLHESGIEVAIVSGDSEEEVRRISSITGADSFTGEASPSEKEEIVRSLQAKGKYVLFLGDGINDAAAIASADVGASVAEGTEIAKSQSDIVFLSGNTGAIFASKKIAEQTVRKIRQNIIYAIVYNVALVPVAAGVLVPIFGLAIFGYLPFLSAAAMGMSSTSVVLNSLRLRGTIRRSITIGGRIQIA